MRIKRRNSCSKQKFIFVILFIYENMYDIYLILIRKVDFEKT